MQRPQHRDDKDATGPEHWRRQSLPSAFRNAWSGLCDAVRTQRNMRIHLAAAAAAIGAGAFFDISGGEWIAVVLSCAAVLTAETINTALEAVVDLVSPQFNPLARQAKDCAAGAVLLSSLASLAVGGIIFLPKLIALAERGWK